LFTLTHVPIGLMAGEAAVKLGLFPTADWKSHLAVLAGVVGGSVLADAHAAGQYYLDVRAGRKPLESVSKTFLAIQEITHSLVVWAIIAGIGIWVFRNVTFSGVWLWRVAWTLALGMLFGWFFHVLVDVFFHKDEKYRKEDPTWIWPLDLLLNWLFPRKDDNGWSLYGVVSIADWRHWAYEKGRLLSWQDGVIMAVSLTIFVVLLVF